MYGGLWMKANREFKSDVFSMLMENRAYALDVYNALNGTEYQDENLIEIVTLRKGISLTVRNDASFVIDFWYNLYEHQSTYSPNVPVRCCIYYAKNMTELLQNYDLYGHRLVKIPTPHFVVFYNGSENRPDKEILKLSDAFVNQTAEPELELKVTVYNINEGHNPEIMCGSKILSGYMYFVDKVRYNIDVEKMELGDAIEAAIEDCIRRGIMSDFFRTRRNEVMKVMTMDYTWERREEIIRREERAEGREEGREEGLRGMVKIYTDELHLTAEEIAVKMGLNVDKVKEMIKKNETP
jgi:hypothetical protein